MKLSHSKLGSTAASIVLAAVSTLLTALPSQADGYRIGFSNGCHSATIRVAVSWKDTNSGEWIDQGWYEFSPGERSLLNGPRTRNRTFYYYAESTDGSKKWYSNDQPALVVNGRVIVLEGKLLIFLMAANNSGTRATVNVVGLDRKENVLFVSKHLDIPTACGRWDTCSSDRRGRRDQQISPEIAKFVNRLRIHLSDRQGPSIYSRMTRAIRESCSTYDELPVTARAAIAAETGFPGCNPAGAP